MTRWRQAAGRVLGALLVMVAAGCDDGGSASGEPSYSSTDPTASRTYVVGVHPLHNPEFLDAIYTPLFEHVGRRIGGIELHLEASRNYAAYEEKLKARAFDFALPNPYQTLSALRFGYRVFGKMGDDDQFRGVLLVRKDSGIRNFSDLKGKAVAYPAPTALAATMMPQALLHANGVDVRRDIENRYVGSQESAIMNVYLGSVAVGVTWLPPWRNFQSDEPDKAADLEVRWLTEALPNNGLVVRDDVPADLVEKVAQELFALHEYPEGRALLARLPLSRFEPATDETYAPVRAFLEHFAAHVREIELP